MACRTTERPRMEPVIARESPPAFHHRYTRHRLHYRDPRGDCFAPDPDAPQPSAAAMDDTGDLGTGRRRRVRCDCGSARTCPPGDRRPTEPSRVVAGRRCAGHIARAWKRSSHVQARAGGGRFRCTQCTARTGSELWRTWRHDRHARRREGEHRAAGDWIWQCRFIRSAPLGRSPEPTALNIGEARPRNGLPTGLPESSRALPSTTSPTGTADGTLTLALGVSGTLTARPGTAGGLELVGADGKAVLRYGDLSVTDARGRALPAHMAVEHGRVSYQTSMPAGHTTR